MRRYPLEPLAAAMCMSLNAACVQLGVSGSTLKKYRDDGVSERVADRLAVRAGFHPAEVWPEFADAGIADAERSCADCGESFLPVNSLHRFCSRPCYRRHHRRANVQRRRATPEGAELNRERRRRYYAENREYERARERRRYHAQREAS